MNEYDPLEAELASFRPKTPSGELKQRIAERIDLASRTAPNRRIPVVGWGAMLTVAAAAVVLCLVLLRQNDETLESRTTKVAVQPPVAAAFDESLPSLWSFRKAVIDSPDELNTLLDLHSARISERTPERARAFVLARSGSEPITLFGDL